MNLLINLIKLFYLYLLKFTDDKRPAVIPGDEDFVIKFMRRFDEDIIQFEKTDICKGFNIDSF
jgi:hypothetical protein